MQKWIWIIGILAMLALGLGLYGIFFAPMGTDAAARREILALKDSLKEEIRMAGNNAAAEQLRNAGETDSAAVVLLSSRLYLLEQYQKEVLNARLEAQFQLMDTRLEQARYEFTRQNIAIAIISLFGLASLLGLYQWAVLKSREHVLDEISRLTGLELEYLKSQAEEYKRTQQAKQRPIVLLSKTKAKGERLQSYLAASGFTNIQSFDSEDRKEGKLQSKPYDLLIINDEEDEFVQVSELEGESGVMAEVPASRLIFYIGRKRITPRPEDNQRFNAANSRFQAPDNLLKTLLLIEGT